MKNPKFKAVPKKEMSADELVAGIRSGDTHILSRAITLVESHNHEDRAIAEQILNTLTEDDTDSIRIGISGSPGVGKSTFIEAYGQKLAEQKQKVAILAVDPTSQMTSGSLLGDKTRMQFLSQSPYVYIRPTPAGKILGGVAQFTREAIILCEAAGFKYILIETVGVGQSETHVRQLCDIFTLLVLPSSGDELQGIKRGIVEIADIILVSKADESRIASAKETKKHYRNAMTLSHMNDRSRIPDMLITSATEGTGIEEFAELVNDRWVSIKESGLIREKRREQNLFWFQENFVHYLKQNFFASDHRSDHYNKIMNKLKNRTISLSQALVELKELLNS